MKGIKISVLINNVGSNHSIPTPFMEEEWSTISSILSVNITNTLALTHAVLPEMDDGGLILNVSSFSGCFSTPLLQTYAASKAFINHFTLSLSAEVSCHRIHVEAMQAYFVTSKMSKIKRASFFCPTPSAFAKEAMKRVGKKTISIPYPSHALLYGLIKLIPASIFASQTFSKEYA